MTPHPTGQRGYTQKLRSACDPCHHAKVKCSEDKPCARCRNNNLQCTHSYAIKAGKPKGSKNQKTLQRLEQNRLEAENSKKTASTSSNGSADANRKRSRERPDDGDDDTQPRSRQFSTSLHMSPMALEMQDTGVDSADNLFSFNVRQGNPDLSSYILSSFANHGPNLQSGDFSTLTMDSNLDISPRSNALDAPFDMDAFSLSDTMQMGPTYGSVATPMSTVRATSIAPNGMCTPELQAPANSGRSSPNVRPLVPNFFDIAVTGEAMLGKTEGGLSTQCFCFSQQAFHLNQLYSLSAQPGVQRLDMWLQSINGTLHAVDCFLLCRQCSKDSSSLLVAIATTQLVLSQIQNLLSHNSSVRVSIGEYRPNQEDELAMKRLLIERAVQRCKNTLKEIRRVSSNLATGPLTPQSQTGPCYPNDVKYLTPVITRLEGLLSALMMDLNGEMFRRA